MRLTVTDQFGGASTTDQLHASTGWPTPRRWSPPPVRRSSTVGTTGVAAHRYRDRPADHGEPGADPDATSGRRSTARGVPLPSGDPLHVTLNNPTTLTPTFDAPATPGTVRFKLTVDRRCGDGVGDEEHGHRPRRATSAPIANAGPDQTGIAAGATVTLDGSGIDRPRGPHDHLRVDPGRRRSVTR